MKNLGLFFILLQSLLFSNIYYVDQNDSNGNDSGPCSLSTPCLTIQVAINKTTMDGDIVLKFANLALVSVVILFGGCDGYLGTAGPDHCGAVEGDEVWSKASNPHIISCYVDGISIAIGCLFVDSSDHGLTVQIYQRLSREPR